jgi:hypothetical protein
MKLKKSFLTLALLAGMSSSAFAGPLTLNGGSLNIGDIDFTNIDLSTEVANATQTDTDNSGDVTGNDAFIEFGSTHATELKLGATQAYGGSLQANTAFGNMLAELIDTVLFFDYTATGTANLIGPNTLSLTFASVTASLYALFDSDDDGATNSLGIAGTANHGFDTKVDLIDFSLASGDCTIPVNVVNGFVEVDGSGSSCIIEFVPTNFYGMFSTASGTSADDLGVGSYKIIYDATVQAFNGLSFNYPTGSTTQSFTISHDANISVDVAEPSSIALLGLTLLGLGGLARKRKA